ncbi:hypothetical protein QFZ24_000455 [Streptomyces phaeochromogenes]|nr:hypothetical protein [Streptomyces phaeochromogenes]
MVACLARVRSANRCPAGQGDNAAGSGWRGPQAAAVPVDALLGSFAEVVPEMPSVGDLAGLWSAAGGSFGEERSPVTADDLDAGPLGEPGRERVCLPVGQQVDRTTCFDVDEHGSVDPAPALGVFVDADHARCGGGGIRERGDQPQQGVPADRDLESIRHAGACPACECVADRYQRRSQPLRPSPEPTSESWGLLGEGLPRAAVLRADEPPHPQRHDDELARYRQITRKAQVGAMYSPRPTSAPRAGRSLDDSPSPNPNDRFCHLDRLHQYPLDRGVQQLIQLRQHFVHGDELWTTPPPSRAIFGRTRPTSHEDR